MGIGEAINKNPMIGVGIAVVILIVAGMILFRTTNVGKSGKPIEQRYFYDMGSGEVIVMGNEPAPVTSASGSTAVWAAVYTCGSCDSETDRFVAYIQKYTDEAKREVEKPLKQQDYDTVNEGTVVAAPPSKAGDEVSWVQIETLQGMNITQMSIQGRCPGAAMATPCMP